MAGYLEIKREGIEREFIFYVTTTYRILHWEECMLDVKEVNDYFKEKPFEDKFFKKLDFLSDLGCEGFIAIHCEKEDTAGYISEMLQELI